MINYIFKLIGLNKPWKTAGFNSIYAIVEYGKEDWFHSRFDEQAFPDDKLRELFSLFKDSEENLWHKKNHKVVIEFDSYTPDGTPINPVIKEIFLDDLKTPSVSAN